MAHLFLLVFSSLVSIGLCTFSNIQADLNRTARECRQSESDVAQLESQLSTVESLHYEKTAHLLLQQKKIARVILLLRSLKAEAPSRIIQSNGKSSRLLHQFSILQCYIRTLKNQINLLQEELSTLKRTKEDTIQRKMVLDEKLATYQRKYARLEELLEQRKKKIQTTLSERKEKEEQARKLADRSKNIKELIKHLEKEKTLIQVKTSSTEISLLAPVPGPLVVNFNQKTPQNPDGSGVVFRTRPGSHVLAPVSGRILYAGPFRLYKKIVIIGFGKTYSLLLTGLDRLDVSVGQDVHVGDPIGLVPTENKNYLYLELRNHGFSIKPHIMKM